MHDVGKNIYLYINNIKYFVNYGKKQTGDYITIINQLYYYCTVRRHQ